MANEQAPADGGASEASVMDRLSAHFGKPEAAPEATAAPEAQTQGEEAEEDAPEAAADDESAEAPESEIEAAPTDAEIEDDDGTKYKVPAKLKDSFLRWSDYTKKTQEVAKVKEAAEDRIQFAEAREQLTQAVVSDAIELKALQAQLEQYNTLDWSRLYQSDPGQAMMLRDQRDQLQAKAQAKENEIRTKAANHERIQAQHADRQWALAVEATKARLGTVSAADDAAMLAQVKSMGFTDRELKTRFADPRFLHLVLKAAKFDAQQSGKPQLLAKVQGAPPVIKPGASAGPGVALNSKIKDARMALKKSGSVSDAARLLRLANR